MNTRERVIDVTVIIPSEVNWRPPQLRRSQPVAVRERTRWHWFQECVAGFHVGCAAHPPPDAKVT